MNPSPTASRTPVPAGRRRSGLTFVGTVILFLVPSAILYFLFVLLPVVQAAYYSFFQWNGLGPIDNFIGLDNFRRAFVDQVFLRAVGNNLLIAGLSLLIQLPFALLLALLIGRHLPGRTIFRAIFFLPFVLSDVVAGVVWRFIYRADGGLLNNLLTVLLPGFDGQTWLGDPNTVMGAIFLVITWKYFGLHLVLYIAGIQDIPEDIIDAARIDGSSAWQVMWHMIIPLLGSTLRLSVFLSVLGSLQFFDLIFVLSDGGPVHASETMATYLIKFGFERFSLGYGSAVGVAMFAICFVFSLTYQRLVMSRDLAGGTASTPA